MKTTSLFRSFAFVAALAVRLTPELFASSPPTPHRHVVTSEGNFLFVMLPERGIQNGDDWVITAPAGGTVYKIKENGNFKRMWTVRGWYAPPREILLSSDGRTLVRIREGSIDFDGTIDNEISQEVVTIYRKGNLIAGYTAKDLIGNKTNGIRFDWGGTYWVDRTPGNEPRIAPSPWYSVEIATKGESTVTTHPPVLQLTTLGGTIFLFDLKTGQILTKKPIEVKPNTGRKVDDDTFEPGEHHDGGPSAVTNAEQPGAGQPATQPADKVPAEVQPPTPTSKDAPR